MGSYTLNFNQLFKPTKLFDDYLKGNLNDYFRYNFTDSEYLKKVALVVNTKHIDRHLLYKVVFNGNKKLRASAKTLQNIELLKQPEALCVFSGQQTGILGGPMLTVYKALTTVKLAEKCQQILKRPVVPCFWMATDDHDFEEVRWASFLQRDGELTTVSYNPLNTPSNIPVAEMVLDENVNEMLESVENSLIDTEFKQPLVDILKEFYSPGRKLSEAFAMLLNYFLGDWGIILVDPNFTGMKEFFSSVYSREILHHDKTQQLFKQRTDQLLKNGYHAQVHKTSESLNLFYHNKGRQNISIEGDFYHPEGTSDNFSAKELLEIVDKSPQRFSANVLLWPVAQCTAFPTLGQAVGPSELAYFAQIEPFFEFFDVPFPVIYPRFGMTIVEPHIKRILNKYELKLPQLKNELERTIGTVIETLYPSKTAEAVVSLQNHFNDDLEKYSMMLQKTDPEGYQHLINFKKHIDYELKQLQKKLKASNKKRHDELTSQIRKTYSYIFPVNKLQERVLSPVYFANKFGPEIFQKIFESLNIDKPVHIILEL